MNTIVHKNKFKLNHIVSLKKIARFSRLEEAICGAPQVTPPIIIYHLKIEGTSSLQCYSCLHNALYSEKHNKINLYLPHERKYNKILDHLTKISTKNITTPTKRSSGRKILIAANFSTMIGCFQGVLDADWFILSCSQQ